MHLILVQRGCMGKFVKNPCEKMVDREICQPFLHILEGMKAGAVENFVEAVENR